MYILYQYSCSYYCNSIATHTKNKCVIFDVHLFDIVATILCVILAQMCQHIFVHKNAAVLACGVSNKWTFNNLHRLAMCQNYTLIYKNNMATVLYATTVFRVLASY